MSDEIIHHKDYQDWTAFIANKIKFTQTQAALKVNAELLTLYWEIGNSIIEKQKQNGWGSKLLTFWHWIWLRISLKLRGFLSGILNICGLLQKHIRTFQ